MPAANTSKLEPSSSERSTAPWFGYDPALAGLVDDVQADVADFPIQPAVGPERDAGDAVAAERRMGVEAVADRRLR